MARQSYSISSRARPAALTALPGNLRDGYVAHLHAILSADCHVLLMMIEDLEDTEKESDNMASSEEIISLYADYFAVALLHAEYHQAIPAMPVNR